MPATMSFVRLSVYSLTFRSRDHKGWNPFENNLTFDLLKVYMHARLFITKKESRATAMANGYPENFRESLAAWLRYTATAAFPEIVNVLLLRSTVLEYVPNLNFVAL